VGYRTTAAPRLFSDRLSRPDAILEAITEEIVIATEAPPANTSATCTGGDRDDWQKDFASATSKTLKGTQMEINSRARYERLCARFATTLATLVGALVLFAVSASAATYTVNSIDDIDDGVCDASHCSLREAINAANANVGSDFVVFDINTSNISSRVATIVLIDALPVITGPVTIDGYSQRSCANIPAPCSRQNTLAVGNDAVLMVELNGAAIADSVAAGLVINAPACLIRGLVINRFPYEGIIINSSASGTIISGNWIGLNATGSFHQPNLGDGLFINNATNVTIGGTTPATRNVISGNDVGGGAGVIITGGAASGNKIQGNYIGTTGSGTSAAGNGTGIWLGQQVHGTTIGGTGAGAGNVISGNNDLGIYLDSAYNNQIQGNLIGVTGTGDFARGNGGVGIRLHNSITNTIGGTTAAARNVISGNGDCGILIDDSSNNVIEGNYIGTNAAGDNEIANAGQGIRMYGKSQTNKIGDSVAGAGNVISGNKLEGISMEGNTSGTLVLRNFIGTKANGTGALGNERDGIFIRDAHNNFIGSTIPNSGNIIAYNGVSSSYYGVDVYGDTAVGNAIRGNSIHDNNGKGIALTGQAAPPNDLDDLDTGQNNLQNSPVVTTAVNSNGITTITGTLNSEADKDYRLEFFANAQCGQTGYGEGQIYLGATGVTTSGHNATFSVAFPGVSIGQVVTATATDPNGNTSEFSQCRQVTAPVTAGIISFSGAAYSISEGSGVATITVTRTGGSGGAVSVQYATTSGGTATANDDYAPVSGTLNWGDGDGVNKTFTIPITDDTAFEINETVKLSLSSPGGGASLGNQSSVPLTINDNDLQPALSINDVSFMEGNSGTTPATFTVTLSNASYQQVVVTYSTSGSGTAILGSDYQPVTNSLTFAPGETSKPVTVTVNGDTTDEPNETFVVKLGPQTNAALAKAEGTGTIVNDDAAPAPTLEFSAGNYSVQENLGAVTVIVTRTGDASGAASVDYATGDGTATQKSDHEIAAGTLNFAPGEVSKSLTILINEDAYIEGNESFKISLSNAAGASLGQTSATTVEIVDDLPESATNPIDDAQSFVYMQYHDFLNREPDPAGLAFWTNEITMCGNDPSCIEAKRTNVSAAFFLSIEFQQTGFLLQLMQKESFSSLPKYAEFMRDLQEIGNGVVVNAPGWQQKLADNQQRFALKWVGRPVFKATYDAMSNAAYVNTLYANAGIVPTPAEQAALVARLDNASETRAGVLMQIAANPAFRQQEQNPGFVMMEYFGYLRRDPNAAPDSDLSGYLFWLNKLNNFKGNYIDAEMVKAFITSFEYRQRFAQ
jgi:CSLREA domain-containing protein